MNYNAPTKHNRYGEPRYQAISRSYQESAEPPIRNQPNRTTGRGTPLVFLSHIKTLISSLGRQIGRYSASVTGLKSAVYQANISAGIAGLIGRAA